MIQKTIFSIFFLISNIMCSQTTNKKMYFPEDIYELGKHWADSVYNSLSEDERISQLFWIAIENPDNKTFYDRNKKLIENYQPGGILLFKATVEKVLEVISDYQSVSKTPLIVSIDGENGLAMRFPDVPEFPKAMTLGAIRDDNLIFQLGLEIARQCRLAGIHVNMAPVADINSNPKNPVIGVRSYGENPDNVQRKAEAYMRGLQQGGVMAVAKHFPGHGDTDADSHKTLPIITHDKARLDSVELFPFKKLSKSGIWGIMSSHIEVPALETAKNVPASFSETIIKNILKNEFNFTGLTITDAVNMKGAKVMGAPGEVDALALAAGNDIVLFTENLPEAVKQVKELIIANKLSLEEIEDKCKRSLAFKYFLTMQNDSIKTSEKIVEELNSFEAKELNKRLFEAAVTLLVDKNNSIPLNNSNEERGCFIIGNAPVFETNAKRHSNIKTFKLSASNDQKFQETLKNVNDYKNIILVVADEQWGRNSANSAKKQQLYDLMANKNTILIFLGNAYRLADWKTVNVFNGLLLSYQNTPESQEAVFKALVGECDISGRLPVSIGNAYKEGAGINRLINREKK